MGRFGFESILEWSRFVAAVFVFGVVVILTLPLWLNRDTWRMLMVKEDGSASWRPGVRVAGRPVWRARPARRPTTTITVSEPQEAPF